MISIQLAQDLNDAGLLWKPTYNDFFAIPGSDLDGRIFVLADMLASQTLLRGWPAITFHGTSEWAMDYVMLQEVVWVPTEEQLRQEVIFTLDKVEPETHLSLALQRDGRYLLSITFQQQAITFNAPTPGETYGQALLHLLRHAPESQNR